MSTICNKQTVAICLFLALWGIVLQTAVVYADVAGTFIFVRGKVWIIDSEGEKSKARKGDVLSEGDTLISEKDGYAQVLMADKGYMAVRPDTEMRIDTFRYRGKADGTEKGIFSLMKGGFRAITGVIGQKNKENYQIKTPVATIGIRGTDHEPMFIPAAPAGRISEGQPGAYDKVNVGEAYIENTAGMVTIGKNEVGFTPDAATVPTRLPAMPAFYMGSPAADAAQEEEGAEEGGENGAEGEETPSESAEDQEAAGTGTDDSEASADDGSAEEGTGAAPEEETAPAGEDTADTTGTAGVEDTFADASFSDPVETTTEDTFEQRITSDDGTVDLTDTSTVETPAYRAVAYAAFDPRRPMPFAVGEGLENLAAEVDINTAGEIVGFNSELPVFDGAYSGGEPDFEEVRFEIGTATLQEHGIDPGTGAMWGRWAGGTISATRRSDGTPVSPLFNPPNVHFIVGPEMTGPVALPVSGTYDYTVTGNTLPTDNLGGVGTLNSAYLQANFTNMTVNAGVDATVSSVHFTADAANMVIERDSTENVWHFDAGNHEMTPLAVTCNSGTSPDGFIMGGFIGKSAEAAGITYSLHTNDTDDTTVSGAVVFKR